VRTAGGGGTCPSATLSAINPTRGGIDSGATYCRILKEFSVNKHWRNIQLSAVMTFL